MSELRTNTISAANGTSPVTLTKQSATKAYCLYDQNTANVFRGSFNFSSFTDGDLAGKASVAFTNNITATDGLAYAVTISVNRSRILGIDVGTSSSYSDALTSSSISLTNHSDSGTLGDSTACSVAVHGDLA
tara:strand:+ start:417 stop:812 length:396 start_codon:yes stop_codon:yes gene_type:complete